MKYSNLGTRSRDVYLISVGYHPRIPSRNTHLHISVEIGLPNGSLYVASTSYCHTVSDDIYPAYSSNNISGPSNCQDLTYEDRMDTQCSIPHICVHELGRR